MSQGPMAVLSWGRAVPKRKAVSRTRTCQTVSRHGTHDPDRKASPSRGKKSAHGVPLQWGWFTMEDKYIWSCAIFLYLLLYSSC